MSSIAEVHLWGRRIGAVSVAGPRQHAVFEFTESFIESGFEVAPLMAPRARRTHCFPELALDAFHGLPGLLADSLPDRFGTAVVDAWVGSQGRDPATIDVVDRLRYTGSRGMGALEFMPALGRIDDVSTPVRVDELVELASGLLGERAIPAVSHGDARRERALRELVRVGSSAGGARAKAVIAWNPQTNEVRSGGTSAPAGFEYWLIKFDGITHDPDHDVAAPSGFSAIEFAYAHMARAAGIRTPDCRLWEEDNRRHFMSRRFDRLEDGSKLHMQSLGAMLHLDYNDPLSHSYEQAFEVIRRLGLPMADVEEQFRRMVFNVLARNQDDHVKNIAFLMDSQGRWSLSPAFDLTFACNPAGRWTARHQMSVNCKRDGITMEDLRSVANAVSIRRERADEITKEVAAAVGRWPEFAEEANVVSTQLNAIAAAHGEAVFSLEPPPKRTQPSTSRREGP